MRELKFRVWDKKRKKMEHDIHSPKESVSLNTVFHMYQELIMQFTELKDKNGKEIYEGDILGDCRYYSSSIVEWDKMRTGFIPFSNGIHFEEAEYVEVIGNIYENPELLKGVKE